MQFCSPIASVSLRAATLACLAGGVATAQTFFVNPGTAAPGDAPFNALLGAQVHNEDFEFRRGTLTEFVTCPIGGAVIRPSVGPLAGAAGADLFSVGPLMPGVVHYDTLINAGPSGGSHTMRFDFAPPVTGFGTWVLDDFPPPSLDYQLVVTDVNAVVTTSPLLPAIAGGGGLTGFLGVVEPAGITRVEVTAFLGGVPHNDFYFLDHVQIGAPVLAAGPRGATSCGGEVTIQVVPRAASGAALGAGQSVQIAASVGTLVGAVVDHGDGTYTQNLRADLPFAQSVVTATINGVPHPLPVSVDFGPLLVGEMIANGGFENGSVPLCQGGLLPEPWYQVTTILRTIGAPADVFTFDCPLSPGLDPTVTFAGLPAANGGVRFAAGGGWNTGDYEGYGTELLQPTIPGRRYELSASFTARTPTAVGFCEVFLASCDSLSNAVSIGSIGSGATGGAWNREQLSFVAPGAYDNLIVVPRWTSSQFLIPTSYYGTDDWSLVQTGEIVDLGGGCGPGGVHSANGPASLGNTSFGFELTGVGAGALLSAVNINLFSPTPLVCGPCRVTPLQLTFVRGLIGTGATFSVSLPCSTAFLQLSLEAQWLTLNPSASPCSLAPPGVAFSNRVRATIQ